MVKMAARQMLELNLSVEGEKSLRAVLQVRIDKIKDLRPAWELIRDDFAARERRWLDSEGERTFAKLSDAYGRWKARNYPGRPILRLTGLLRRSLTQPGDPEFLYVPERLRVTLGTTVPYARWHQRGTSTEIRTGTGSPQFRHARESVTASP